MDKSKRILFILKDAEGFDSVQQWLKESEYQAELYLDMGRLTQGQSYDAFFENIGNYLLVSMDLDLPWALEFCNKCKSDSRGKNVPFIMMAYRAKLKEVISGIMAGADNFIMKPFETDYFISRLKLIEKESQLALKKGKIIDLSLLRFVFTIIGEEAAGYEVFDLFKAAFEKSVVSKSEYVLGKAPMDVVFRSSIKRVSNHFPFLGKIQYSTEKGLLVDKAAIEATTEPKDKVIAGLKQLVKDFLETISVLTTNILVEDSL